MSHYFDPVGESPHPGRTLSLKVAGRELTLQSGGGVFGRNAVDTGTQVLLDSVSPPASAGELLDIGCGYGPIALSMAALAPAATVWAVDVNERARGLCRENAAAAGLGNVRVCAPDEVPEQRFATIWSNPPIRIGKKALHELLERWLSRLAQDGAAYLVVQRNLGSDSLQAWLEAEGWPTTRFAARHGFRVLQCAARPAETRETDS
jgi:16S rRNA (guanine1207-N2)-methyltransferase